MIFNQVYNYSCTISSLSIQSCDYMQCNSSDVWFVKNTFGVLKKITSYRIQNCTLLLCCTWVVDALWPLQLHLVIYIALHTCHSRKLISRNSDGECFVYFRGQYLLRFSTAQHSFQLKMRTRLAVHDGFADLSQSENMSIGDTEDMNTAHSDDNHTITEETGSHSSRNSQVLWSIFYHPLSVFLTDLLRECPHHKTLFPANMQTFLIVYTGLIH